MEKSSPDDYGVARLSKSTLKTLTRLKSYLGYGNIDRVVVSMLDHLELHPNKQSYNALSHINLSDFQARNKQDKH
jgi:hypothetical protein